jgi:hypothetical protein
MKRNKKALLALAILFLVVLEITLIVFTLVWFNMRDNSANKKIDASSSVDSIYLREELVNLNIQEIFDRAVYGFKSESGKEVFIKNFKDELNKLKDVNGNYIIPELSQIENQITPENINIDNKQISFNLKINLNIHSGSIKASYSYSKNFEKIFNLPILLKS